MEDIVRLAVWDAGSVYDAVVPDAWFCPENGGVASG
jgi:hypothetical protein